MSSRKKDQKRDKRRKRLDSYKKSGKILLPPLAAYPNKLKPLNYHQQLLPQLLWLESILDLYGEKQLPGRVYKFLDLIDALGSTGSDPVSGLVESFLFVPQAKQAEFVANNRDTVESMVIKPFGPALFLYPNCPMNWLMDLYGRDNYEFNLDLAIKSLKHWTSLLLDREGDHANMVRTIVLVRYMKTGKIRLPNDPSLINELVAYPNCKDRRATECMLRALSLGVLGNVMDKFTWGNNFWTTNGRISMCTAQNDEPKEVDQKTQDEIFSNLITIYVSTAEAFLKAIRQDYLKCVPDPNTFEKTSVLSGLLARASALGLDMLTEQNLWKAEVGGILLRCLCDTLILLAWLVHKDDVKLYQQFVQYSLGQQDLYGLKVEGLDGYREAFQTLCIGDEKQADVISKDSWDAQLRTIDLGNWADMNTRKMAEEGGTKLYYDLVFSLCSADVHSQFISLARWNMVPCTNPLHNYHLMPAFGRRIVNPFLPLTSCALLKEICQRFFGYYKVEADCTKVLEEALNKSREIIVSSAKT